MDHWLTIQIHQWAGQAGWLDGVIFFLAEPLAYFLGLAAVIAWFKPVWLGFDQSRWSARHIIAAGLAAAFFARVVIKEAVVLFIDRARPFEVLEELKPLIEQSEGASLPSGHAIFFFTLTAAWLGYNRRIGWWLGLGAGLMALARVAAGVHWVSDVLAGAGLGLAFGLAVSLVLQKRLKKNE